MVFVSVDDVVARLDPRPDPATNDRIQVLLNDAEDAVRVAFMRAGLSLESEIARVPWLDVEVRRVIREMVSAAIIIGPNAGVRTASSATGQESDSITYADVDSVSFGGVRLTDAQRRALGIPGETASLGWFPKPWRWPERRRP